MRSTPAAKPQTDTFAEVYLQPSPLRARNRLCLGLPAVFSCLSSSLQESEKNKTKQHVGLKIGTWEAPILNFKAKKVKNIFVDILQSPDMKEKLIYKVKC